MHFKNKRVLITGGTSGIGKAFARVLSQKGAAVAVCARRQEALKKLQSVIPGIVTISVDLSKKKEIACLKKILQKEMGGIDILINNAGKMAQFDVSDGFPNRYENEIALNLNAPVELCRLFLPQLLKRDRTAIINVTSGYALWPNKTSPLYCATKSALHFFTKSIRWQLENSTVKVIEVLPPLVKTPSAAKKGGMDPLVFAKKVISQIEDGKTEIKIAEVKALSIFMRLTPFVIDRVLRKM
ncbi:SDR family NAD(P)-dependent oxidoreductase [Chitinispirillales bacterium ANBcel5]|uniref:SDR family oxidoreductase n=1 Tax=Cellulosispirillum alkaliphilum TaxID=3039283 RepID=UPI002A538BBE|nr:SDR family NAD(P)-dependent oxidoreductase [Chitinispirillales bacterium ANBcel5]